MVREPIPWVSFIEVLTATATALSICRKEANANTSLAAHATSHLTTTHGLLSQS
jgi:hypothetical protein